MSRTGVLLTSLILQMGAWSTVTASEAYSLPKNPDPASSREPASTTRAIPTRSKEQTAEINESRAEEDASDALFGNWGGAKDSFLKSGFEVGAYYKADWMGPLDGPNSSQSTFMGNLDITANINLETLAGAKGLSLFLYGLANHGSSANSKIGDSFVTSNIDAPEATKLYEAYLKQDLDERSSLLVGLRDLNADFYVTRSSLALVNSMFGISQTLSQTGPNGPSIFPATALALSFKYQSQSNFYFQSGAFNAMSGSPTETSTTFINTSANHGHLLIWETGIDDWDEAKDIGTKIGFGAWTYSQPEATLSGEPAEVNNWGYYALIDTLVTPTTSVFIRYGTASPLVSQFDRSGECGILFRGLIPGREDDKLSIGYAAGKASSIYRELNSSAEEESVTELSYRFELGSGVAVAPDLHIVRNAGLTADTAPIQVGNVRFEINF